MADLALPADPANPTPTEREPAWVHWLAGSVAYLVVLVAARWGLDLEGDDALIASFVSGPIVYALSAWRTRRKVNSAATVARVLGPGGGV